jgi:hypothetical protein
MGGQFIALSAQPRGSMSSLLTFEPPIMTSSIQGCKEAIHYFAHAFAPFIKPSFFSHHEAQSIIVWVLCLTRSQSRQEGNCRDSVMPVTSVSTPFAPIKAFLPVEASMFVTRRSAKLPGSTQRRTCGLTCHM